MKLSKIKGFFFKKKIKIEGFLLISTVVYFCFDFWFLLLRTWFTSLHFVFHIFYSTRSFCYFRKPILCLFLKGSWLSMLMFFSLFYDGLVLDTLGRDISYSFLHWSIFPVSPKSPSSSSSSSSTPASSFPLLCGLRTESPSGCTSEF